MRLRKLLRRRERRNSLFPSCLLLQKPLSRGAHLRIHVSPAADGKCSGVVKIYPLLLCMWIVLLPISDQLHTAIEKSMLIYCLTTLGVYLRSSKAYRASGCQSRTNGCSSGFHVWCRPCMHVSGVCKEDPTPLLNLWLRGWRCPLLEPRVPWFTLCHSRLCTLYCPLAPLGLNLTHKHVRGGEPKK